MVRPSPAVSQKLISVGMLSLGCPKTLVDSEVILGLLNPARFRMAPEIGDCDIALLNTCAFVQDAKQESIDYILKLAELKREGRIKAVVVLGCLVQRYVKDLERELTEVDAFVGTGDYRGINQVLEQVAHRKRLTQVGHAPGFLYTADIGRVPLTPRHTRYIKISEGCDHVCSFCTIPSFRGKHRSRQMADILAEAERLVSEGARELVLTGQDTTYYGRDLGGRYQLPELLTKLNELKGLRWLRLLYAYPSLVDQVLIEALAGLRNMCRYLDMPLQHISDRMLRAMKRGITKEGTRRLIERLRSEIPGLAIRTTFIVGFPGETEQDFDELLDFMSEARLERLGIFMYSQEEGSGAAMLSGQVPERVKEKRFHAAMALQQTISRSINQGLIGRTLTVLVEERDEKQAGVWCGRTYMDAPEVDGTVYVKVPHRAADLSPGDFVSATIEGAREYDLNARFNGMANPIE